MPDYDKLAAQFGGTTDPGQVPDKYDLAAQKFGGVAGGSSAPAVPQRQATGMQRAQALGAGVNKGLFSDLAGLPVDTIANVLDLGRAGIGTLATMAGRPDLAPDLPDRSTIVGSSDWIARKIGQGAQALGAQSPVAPVRPDDTMSRVLFATGRGVGNSVSPAKVSTAVRATSAAMGGASGLAGGATAEVAPDWAGLAGMLPLAGVQGSVAAAKLTARGGEAGRQAMAQRILDLKNGGIDNPSVGLATGNSLLQGIENLLSHVPGSAGLYSRAKDANIAGMKAKVDALRDSISKEFGPVVAGSAVQADLKGSFRNRINDTTRALNEQVADNVGPNFYSFPQNALDIARSMSAINPAAPATSAALRNGRIAGIADDLARDVMGTPIPGDPLMNQPTRYLRADGQVMEAPPGIPFETLKNLRTSIGEESSSPAILGTPEGAQFKRLYGAMSQDMRQAVSAADRQNAGVDVGPLLPGQLPASMALNRANTFYSRAATRAEDLNGIANRSTPEGAYGAVANSLNSGPSLYTQLRGAIDTPTRQKVVATIVDQMGMATPGQQNAAGDAWSPRTFLTNFAKLHENGGGDALFKRLPGGQKQADQLADIAKASEMVGDASKVWANPSGTGAALTNKQTLWALSIGALVNPHAAAGTAAGLGLSHQVSQRLLLNPRFVNWLSQSRTVSPAKTQATLQRLIMNAKMWGDKQLQQDVGTYVDAVQSAGQDSGGTQ